MSSTQHKSLARSIEQWQNCDPHAMATRQSYAAIEYAFIDAKRDILALSAEVAALKAQRDELVGALDDAKSYIQGGSCGEGDAEASQLSERVYALIAKHAGIAS